MKLRLPHKFQAALMAALASVSFTTLSTGTLTVAAGAALLAGQQAQAEDIVLSNVITVGTTKETDYTSSVWGGTGSIITSATGRYVISGNTQDHTDTAYTNSFFAPETNIGTGNPYTFTLTFKTGTFDGPQTLSSISVDFLTYDSGGKAHSDSSCAIKCDWALTSSDPTASGTISSVALPNNGHGGQSSAAYTKKDDGTYTTNSYAGGTANITLSDFQLESDKTYTLTLGVSKAAGPNGFFVGIGNIAFLYTPESFDYTWAATTAGTDWMADNAWTKDGVAATFTANGNATFGSGAASVVGVSSAVVANSVTVSGQDYTFNLTGSNASLTASALTVESGLSITGTGTVTAGSVNASGHTINIGSGATLAATTLTVDDSTTFTLSGAGNMTAGSLSLGSGSALSLGENAHLTISAKPSLSGHNVTLAEGSVLDLSAYSSDVNDIKNIIGNVTGAGTVKINGSGERSFAANQTDTLLTNLEFISSAEFNGTGWQNPAGHTFYLGNGTDVTGGIKVTNDLRLESEMHINVRAGSSLTVGGNLIMGHSQAGNPGHVDVNSGTLSVGHIKFQDDSTPNTITLTDATVEATQAGNLFANNGNASTVSATNVTLKSTGVDWAWNRAIAFGGTLAVEAGTHTITLGAAGANFSVAKAIELTSGTVAFAGNWELGAIEHTGTTTYTGGAVEGTNGFAKLATELQLVNVGTGASIGSTANAHFTIDGVTATLDANGLAKTSGEVDYGTFHVITGSETVSQGRKDSHNPVYSLADNTTLVVDEDLTNAQLTRETGATGTATLTGAGTYTLSGTGSLGTGIVLHSTGWTGKVKVTGTVNDLNMVPLGTANSTIVLDGWTGYFNGAPNIASTVEIGSGGAHISDGSSSNTITFAGTLTGSGDIERTDVGSPTINLKFTGDVSGYTGNIIHNRCVNNNPFNITFDGSANEINAAALKNGETAAGNLNITFAAANTVVNSVITRNAANQWQQNQVNVTVNAATTFNETVTADKVEIGNGASATFNKAVSLKGDLTMNGTAAAQSHAVFKEDSSVNVIDLSHGGNAHGTVTVATGKTLTYGGSFWGANNNQLILEEGATVQKTSGAPVTIKGLEGGGYVSSSANDLLELGKSAFTLHNVEATINTASNDVQLHFEDSRLVTGQNITLKDVTSTFSGMVISGNTTTVGSGVAADTTVQLGEVTLSGGNLTLAEHVIGAVNGIDVTDSGTVTAGKLVMGDIITMGANATLTLSDNMVVDVSALSSGEVHPEYVEGQHNGSGFSSLSALVQLVDFTAGGTVNAQGVSFIMGSNTGTLILDDSANKGYVSFADASYTGYYVNVAGETESLNYAIETSKGGTETPQLEAVYLNAGILNADVDTKVGSLHIHETADVTPGEVSITGTAANFGTVSGKGTLNVGSATALHGDTLSIAAGDTLTLAGSQNITFGNITSHGTLDIGANTLVTATGGITVHAEESLTTTGEGKLTGTSLTVYGAVSLGSEAEFSGDLNPNSGSLTISGHTTVRGTLHGGDLVDNVEYKSAAILVEESGVLDVNNISANWGFSSFTVNGALNVADAFLLTTGNSTYTVGGSGTITTKKLTLNNEGKYVIDGASGLTLVVGEGGIAAGSGNRTLTLANGLTVKASADWTMNQNAMLNGTVNLNTQGHNLTISSVLSNAAGTTGGLAISGGGTVALNAGNSFSGGLTVTGEGTTVVMGNNNALGNGGNNITVKDGATVDINGKDNTVYNYTLHGGSLVNNGSNDTSLDHIQNASLTLTADSTVGGSHKMYMVASGWGATTANLNNHVLTKEGAGTFSFVNTAVSPGTIKVNEGTVEFNSNKTLSRVQADIELNGGTISGSYKYADSETAVSRALTANRDVTATASMELGTNVTLATNVATGKTLTMSGAITGNGGLSKDGAGTLELTGAVSYNGNTAVNQGTLALGSSITTTGGITVASGAGITFANGATITANSLGLVSGSTLDFSAYQGAIGSKVNVVTTTAGVTGFDVATIVNPAITVQGLTTAVKQEGNNIVITFTPEAEGTMHLYILTGQSNSLGSVKGNPAPADLFAQYASGGLLYNGNMHKGGARYVDNPDWKIVDVQPRGEGDASYAVTGPEYVFEYMMIQKGWFSDTPSTDSIGVIKASLDGGGDEYWVKGGASSNYGVILDTVTKGYREAEAMGYSNVTIDGLLYLQGESNTHGGTAVQTNYTTFLANLKADLEAAGINTAKILFGEHSVLGEPATWNQTATSAGNEKSAGDTHTQLENLAKTTAGIDFVYTRDLDKINPDDGMGVHYNGEAQITIGARYAYAFAVQNGKDVSYVLDNGKKGVVRGSNDQVALTEAGAWWSTAPDANTVAVWDVSSVSTPSSAVQLQGYGNYIAEGATWSVGGIHVADAYKQLVTINGGTISLGADGINLAGGGLSATSAVTVRESQTWQAAAGHKLAVNGTTTIATGATLTMADDLHLTFGYITGTGSLEIGTVTFDMDLDYMGALAKAQYISTKGIGANGYVNEVNLIDLTAGDGSITFTHGGGVNDITKAGGLADCTLTLGDNNQTLKATMPSTAPKTMYFTRSGEVVYTADDDGENGIYKATELVLSGLQDSPATLTLSTALKDGVSIMAEGLGGTVKVDSNVVLNASSVETDGAPVAISGSGEYVGHAVGGTAASVSAAAVLGQGVTLSDDWKGSVVLSGGNASFGGYTSMNALGDYHKADSTIVFNGLYAYFDNNYTVDADIEFRGTGADGTGTAFTMTAGNQKTVNFTGTITGKGNFVYDKNGGSAETFNFSGNIAEWTGSITTGDHNSGALNLIFSGAVTDVNAAITKGANHPINVTVDATNAVSFNAALTGLNSLTVNGNKSASVLGGIGTNATTLNAGASLTIGGTDTTNSLGTVTVSGAGSSLTINQAATASGVTLNANASTTVTNNVAGTNLGNVTFNNDTALTIAGTAPVAAGNVKVNDQCAATITLGTNFTMEQLDTIGANKTLSIASAEGEAKTLTTGQLGFDNVGTVISLQNVNMVVTGAATAGVLDHHNNNTGTMKVGAGATLDLQGTTAWNTSNSEYVDLVIENGGAVSVTGGEENKLRGVNLGAGSSLTFGEGTATTIGGAVVLANTITNDGAVTLTGTVNLDALTAIYEQEGYVDGHTFGNGFYTMEAEVRVFTENHVGTITSSAATVTYKGVQGTIGTDGVFDTSDNKDLSTFYVKKEGSSENYSTAYDIAGTSLTTVSLDDATAINMDRTGATLGTLTLAVGDGGAATVNTTANGTIGSIRGLAAGQKLNFTGATATPAVLTLNGDNTGNVAGDLDITGVTVKLGSYKALGAYNGRGAAAGTNRTITVGAGGVLDMNGQETGGDHGYRITLDGGTLTNTGTARKWSNRQPFTNVVLASDSKAVAANDFGIMASGWNPTTLDLQDHVLEVSGSGRLYLSNTTVNAGENGLGTILAKGGTVNFNGNDTDASRHGSFAGNLQMAADGNGTAGTIAGRLKLGGTTKVSSTVEGDTPALVTADIDTNGQTLRFEGSQDINVAPGTAGGENYNGRAEIKGNGTIEHASTGTTTVSGSMANFTGSVDVQAGELNIMNIAQATSLNVKDVTIGASATMGVYNGTSATAETASEGILTIKNGNTLTASGEGAKLNANLVMDGGATLDVRGTNGAGLAMGSSVTLNQGMTLNDYSSDWSTWEDGATYTLFTGVDGLNIGSGIGTAAIDYTQWVDASQYFENITESNRYFLCYQGAPAASAEGVYTGVGTNGANVGMVYIMAMPEPTTSTLSLLALCALAARRRRK